MSASKEPESLDEAIRAHRADPSDPGVHDLVLSLAAADPAAARPFLLETVAASPPWEPAPPKAAVPPEAGAAHGESPYAAPPARKAPATNWGTNVTLGAGEARRPVNTGQAMSTLGLAVKSGMRARGIGASHSASVVLATPGVLVDSGTLTMPESTAVNSGLRQCRELSPRSWYAAAAGPLERLVEVGSGARVDDVVSYLSASSRALPMTGSYTGQTLVGAFMTSTHGAGVIHPPLQAAVRSIQMLAVNAAGEVEELRVERSNGITDPAAYGREMPHVRLIQDDEVFLAAVVSMGCMGFVLSVIIETVPPFFLYQESLLTTWPEARGMLLDVGPDGVPAYFKGSYNGGVLLSPYPEWLGLGGKQYAMLSRTFLRDAPPPGAQPPTSTPVSALLVTIARFVSSYLPALTPALLNYSIESQSTVPVWGPGNAVTGSATELPQGFSAEHGFPLAGIVPALDAILARMLELAEKKRKMLTGPISLRYVGGTDALLSMTSGGSRCFAEILTLAGAGAGAEVLADIEPLALDHGSRPHWGQWFSPEAVPRIIATYPGYERWKNVWTRLDPTGLFHNAFTARLP